VGAEHLNARSRAAVVLGALAIGAVVVACGSGAAAPAGDASRVTLAGRGGKRGAHVQIVRALPMAERVALVERFKARNGAGWAITLGAGGAPDDVDAIRGVVRRARREGNADAEAKENAKENADAEAKADAKENAIAEAVGFLGRNAEFFGMSPSDVPALDVEIGPAKTATYGSWVVHAQGKIPMRGYEGFASVRSAIDVLVYIGDDGATRYFINLSRVHPRLVLDTTPVLGPDDARVMRFVIGREVFVVFDDPRRPNARVRELRRKSLGRIEDKDVRAVRLTIHVSPGPRGAYVSYWLAYAIDVRREGQDFRFIVDADTGDLLEDAVVPVLPASPLDED
jgi:hypothetical protein